VVKFVRVNFIKSTVRYWLRNSKYTGYPALNDSIVLVQFDKPKRTGKLYGIDVYNHLFVKVKGNWFTPVIYPAVKNLIVDEDNYLKPITRIEKIKKYYSERFYENISDVYVYGNNHSTNLMVLLALWTPFELVRKYYNLSRKLFEKYHWVLSRYSFLRYGNVVKLGLFDFVKFLDMIFYGNDAPLFYDDGAFVATVYNMINNLSVYNESSVSGVLQNIINVYSDPDFNYKMLIGSSKSNLPWTVYSSMYPFIIWRIPSDYGYIVNYSLMDYVKHYGEVKFVRVNAPPEKWYKKDIIVLKGWENVFVSNQYDVAVDDEYLYFWAYDRHITKISIDDVQTAFIGYRRFNKYSRFYGINVKNKNDIFKHYELSTRFFEECYGDRPTIILKK